MRRVIVTLAAIVSVPCGSWMILSAADAPEFHDDVQLRAMIDEIARAKTLKLNELDKPYFIQYSTSDSDITEITASLGGLISSTQVRLRRPTIQVRVGDYSFDNTNSIYSNGSQGGLLPIDDDYGVMRSHFWLSTDGLYKAATDQITRKRNALRDMADPDSTPDFAPASPIQIVQKVHLERADAKHWEALLRDLSDCFTMHPAVTGSSMRLRAVSSAYRLVTSQGTVVRIPQTLAEVSIQASGFAADGNRVWNHDFITTLTMADQPNASEIKPRVERIASETEALTKAPVADEYSGPVLFEGEAAAEMMAQALADAIRLERKPVAPPGANNPGAQMLESVWASRVGQQVTPEWMTLVDDPHQIKFGSAILAGFYEVDDEGVAAARVDIVEKGVLKGFLSSRRPVRTLRTSNGHGRLPGPFSGEAAVIGNLFVQVDHPAPEQEMKTKLIEKMKTAGLKYGIVIRRIDFPSTAKFQELQAIGRLAQKNGYARTLNPPILAYRVYPDGREELIRGLRFKEFSARDLRNIAAASDHPYVLNYVNNGTSFNLVAGSTEATTSSVICPSLLLDTVDLGHTENDAGKLPIVPAPELIARR